MKIKTVKEVSEWRLCIGCGACAYTCKEKRVKLIDSISGGIRPVLENAECRTCDDCLMGCPGINVLKEEALTDKPTILELMEGWGTILEVWEGYAGEKEIRFEGSSGGLSTAIAKYCLEKEGTEGILHAGSDQKVPWENRTYFSRSSEELIARTGSRYAPASPCDELGLIESAERSCIFVGKGCDVAGLRKAASLKPELAKKISGAIGIFCAGTPSTQGTLDLLARLGVDPGEVNNIRYRGRGWPGNFSVTLKDGSRPVSIPYMKAWEFLQKYRPFRCYLCPDATAELADISCGDPWYREKKEDELGYSLVLVRTERGREIVRGAIEAGYVVLEKRDPGVLVKSQKGMLEKKGAIWGRLLAMKAFGVPAPKYEGFYLKENWKQLPFQEKARAVLGTVRRILERGYYRPEKCQS